jgi:hypothetical protein
MSRTSFARGDFTDYLIQQLSNVLLVGDSEAPGDGGWDDDPNLPSSSYVPYVVLNAQTTQEATGSLGDSNSEYRVPYSLTFYGVSRGQVEFYADKARKVIVDLARTVVLLGDFEWKIQQARVNSIGAIGRSDNTEPSEFTQTDIVVLYVSKEI